jgi:hypothetical protein
VQSYVRAARYYDDLVGSGGGIGLAGRGGKGTAGEDRDRTQPGQARPGQPATTRPARPGSPCRALDQLSSQELEVVG